MLIENMAMAFHAIKANKMRSFLTMLGIIIGIGSVISIVSIGDTMRGLFQDLYKDVGITQAYIQIGYWIDDVRMTDYFTLDDLDKIKEVFGELRYMGADYCYRYDKDTRKKTEDIEAVKLHLGSMKLGNSVDIRLEMTETPTIEPYSVVELDTPVYAPYVQRGNYPTLVERVTCKGIRCISQKNA
mgnify:CR=1 FL=1